VTNLAYGFLEDFCYCFQPKKASVSAKKGHTYEEREAAVHTCEEGV
jgi:hypothetical protein